MSEVFVSEVRRQVAAAQETLHRAIEDHDPWLAEAAQARVLELDELVRRHGV